MNKEHSRPARESESIATPPADIRFANEWAADVLEPELLWLGEAVRTVTAPEELPAPHLSQRVSRILETANEPLPNREIVTRLNSDGYGEVNPDSVRSQLSNGNQNGRIKRVSRDFYASRDFNETSDALLPRLTIVERVTRILEIAGEPLTNDEISCRLNNDGYGEAHRGSVNRQLSFARDRQMIQRLDHGLYASPAFEERVSGRPLKKSTLPGIIIRVINNASQPLNAEAITIAAICESGREYKKDSVVHALVAVCRQEYVKRVVPGYYASVDFEGSFQPPQPDNIETRFLNLLADDKMAFSEIVAGLKADGLPSVSEDSLMNQLGISCRAGRIQRLDRGLYASANCKGPNLLPENLQAKTLAILEAAGEPLTRAEIFARLESKEEISVKSSTVQNILERAGRRGEVKRLRRGVYVRVLDAGEANRPAAPESLKQRVRRVLEAAGEPLLYMEIASRLSREASGRPSLDNLRSRLSDGCRDGSFVRLERGLYTHPSADTYRTPEEKSTLTDKVLAVLETAGEPMTCAEIIAVLQADESEGISSGGVRNALSCAFSKGRIGRLERGVYAPLCYQPPESIRPSAPKEEDKPFVRETKSQAITQSLADAGKPMTAREIVVDLGLPVTFENMQNTRSLLWQICVKGKIRRLSRGVYASLSFEESHDTEVIEPLSTSVLETLENSGRPMSVKQIVAVLNQTNVDPVKAASVKALLSKAHAYGHIKRPSRGLYAAPDYSAPIPVDIDYRQQTTARTQPALANNRQAETAPLPSGNSESPDNKRTSTVAKTKPPARQESLNRAVIRALESTGKPMSIREVVVALDQSPTPNNINRALRALSRAYKGAQIQRCDKGVYASRNFGGVYEPNKKQTLSTSVLETLENSGRPMSVKQIVAVLNQTNVDPVKAASVKALLSKASARGRVKRLRPGLYVAPDYSGPIPDAPARRENRPVSRRQQTADTRPVAKTAGKKKAAKKADAIVRPPMSIGRKIPLIVDHWEGQVTVDEVFSELERAGYKDLNRQSWEPLVISVLGRKRRLLGL